MYLRLRAPFQVSAFWGTLTVRLRKEKLSPPPPGLWDLWHNTDPCYSGSAAGDRKYLRTCKDPKPGRNRRQREDRYGARHCLIWALWEV